MTHKSNARPSIAPHMSPISSTKPAGRRRGLLLAGALTAASGGLSGCCDDRLCEGIQQMAGLLQFEIGSSCSGRSSKEEFVYNFSNIEQYMSLAISCYLQDCKQASDTQERAYFRKIRDQLPPSIRSLLHPIYGRRVSGARGLTPDALLPDQYGRREALAYNAISPLISQNTTIALSLVAVPMHATLDAVADSTAEDTTMTHEASLAYAPADAGSLADHSGTHAATGHAATPPVTVAATQYTLVAPATAIDVTGGAAQGSYALVSGTMAIADLSPHPEGGLHAVPSAFNALFVNGGTGDTKTSVLLELDRTCPYNTVTVRSDGVGVFAARMHMTTFNRSLPSVSDVLPTVWIELPLDFSDAQSPIVISTPAPVPGQALFPWIGLANDPDVFRIPEAAHAAEAHAVLPEIDPGPCVVSLSALINGLDITNDQSDDLAELLSIEASYFGSQLDRNTQPNPGNPAGGKGGDGEGGALFACAFLEPAHANHPSKWWKKGDPIPQGSFPIDLNPDDDVIPFSCQCVDGGDMTVPPGRRIHRALNSALDSLLNSSQVQCASKPVRVHVAAETCPPEARR